MDEKTIRPKEPHAFPLKQLSEKLELKTEDDLAQVSITGVTLDSRDVRKGDAYFAIPGANKHGAEFVAEAIARGANAIITDEAGKQIAGQVSVPVLFSQTNLRSIMGQTAATVYETDKNRQLRFGVTGTNGKTSVVYFLDTFLRLAGELTAISTTAERRIGDSAIESGLTSPESSELHALLARAAEEGASSVALEVSAQAVVRNRLDGLIFDVVAFNNFSQDHLDEFGDMETYFAAKLALFHPNFAKQGVVVVDTAEGQRVAKKAQIPVVTLATEYGQEADWHLAITRESLDGVSFVLQGPDNTYFRGRVPLFGTFMAENAALALIMLHQAGFDLQKIFLKLQNKPIPVEIPGRLELISEEGKNPRFYVDYAHTPGSFQAILGALDEVKTGRLIFLFGADGDRDTTKREEMGRVASEYSDVLLICDYNPRHEDPQGIRTQLIEGAKSAKYPAEIHEIPSPPDAIRFAIQKAEKDDIILYAGPGHESFQEVAGNMISYSARDDVRVALREAGINN